MTKITFKGCHMTYKVHLSNWGSFLDCISCPFRARGVPVLFSKGTGIGICSEFPIKLLNDLQRMIYGL
jgi:hypothetical protein